jgi:hypothetical protein
MFGGRRVSRALLPWRRARVCGGTSRAFAGARRARLPFPSRVRLMLDFPRRQPPTLFMPMDGITGRDGEPRKDREPEHRRMGPRGGATPRFRNMPSIGIRTRGGSQRPKSSISPDGAARPPSAGRARSQGAAKAPHRLGRWPRRRPQLPGHTKAPEGTDGDLRSAGPEATNKSAVPGRRLVPRSPALRPANLVPGTVPRIAPRTGLAVQSAPSGKTKCTVGALVPTTGLSTNLQAIGGKLSPNLAPLWTLCGYTRPGGRPWADSSLA